jgi:SAM-dependent methyltransferase
MAEATPVRRLGERTAEGWVQLRTSTSPYRDGAESALYDLVLATDDLASTSTTLVERADGYAERYHTEPARSNVLRPLHFPDGARVLEVGAGCGAVTRYIGEQAALVDAVEPVAARARVARARTRDLPGVEVFVGMVDDVPLEPTYDVVVVVGVLEYVGDGGTDPEPYRTFLSALVDRLVPGGTLVVAIENKLGVKYLAGAAEDHTGRPFDSLESYPSGTPARTFSRRELVELFEGIGVDVETRAVFPDYKLTRAVLDTEVLDRHAPQLTREVPRFPSEELFVERPRITDEGALWRSLVDAGLSAETPNSLLVVAHKRGGETPSIWPEDLAGSFYSVGRCTRYLTESRLVREPEAATGLRVDRRLLVPEAGGAESDPRFVATTEPVQPGEPFARVVGEGTDEDAATLLRRWLELLDAHAAATGEDAEHHLDLMPQNLLVTPDGSLVPVDQEWTASGDIRDVIVRRGLLRLGTEVAERTSPARWPGLTTVRDLVDHLAGLAGITTDDTWWTAAVADDARMLALVARRPAVGDDVPLESWWGEQVQAKVDRALSDFGMGVRVQEQLAEALGNANRLSLMLDGLQQDRDRLFQGWTDQGRLLDAVELERRRAEHELAEARAQLAEVRGRLTSRLDERVRTVTRPLVARARAAARGRH